MLQAPGFVGCGIDHAECAFCGKTLPRWSTGCATTSLAPAAARGGHQPLPRAAPARR